MKCEALQSYQVLAIYFLSKVAKSRTVFINLYLSQIDYRLAFGAIHIVIPGFSIRFMEPPAANIIIFCCICVFVYTVYAHALTIFIKDAR
jgi:hypothetical protein